MAEHLVVMFAYHFPPENAIGGARPARFAKYLERLGYTIRVFTAAAQQDTDRATVKYVPDPFSGEPKRNWAWHLERATRKVVLPSEVGIRWSRAAARAARIYLRTHPTAKVTVFSTFPPLGAHFAAWQFARSCNVRWIADFRDPLAHEWKHTFLNPAQKTLYRRLERGIAHRADAVIANTDAARTAWLEKYPSLADKIHLIWNGFDPDDLVEPLPILARNYKLLTHTGELYLGRTATPILESIERLIGNGHISASKVRVRLIGLADPECLPGADFVRRAENQGWLRIQNEQIPQRDARHICQTSDGFLLLQPHSDVQVPGKLFDYLRIGRPILAFIQPKSPTERILERSGVPYRAVYPNSAPEAVDQSVVEFFDLPSTPVSPSAWFEKQFNAKYQTKQLDRLICAARGHGSLPSGKRAAPGTSEAKLESSSVPRLEGVTASATCPSVRVTGHDIGDSVFQSSRSSA